MHKHPLVCIVGRAALSLLPPFLVLACTPALRADLPLSAEQPTLYDDFSTPYTNNWNPRVDTKGQANDTASALFQTPGVPGLEIHGTVNSTSSSGAHYDCGGVYGKVGYSYGYFETSFQIPSVTGWHCSFWPLSTLNEIDTPEITSNAAYTSVLATLHTHYWLRNVEQAYLGHIGFGLDASPGNVTNSKREVQVSVTAADYHTYGMEITPSSVAFYIDGAPVASTRYPGPHAPNFRPWITMLAYTSTIQTPAVMKVAYYKFYRRNYGFPDWNSAAVNVATPITNGEFKDNTTGLNPDQMQYVPGATTVPKPELQIPGSGVVDTLRSSTIKGAVASWNFPATTNAASGYYEVLAWNASTFPKPSISVDIPDAPDSNGNPTGIPVVYNVGGKTISYDRVYDGQSWLGLGAFPFSGATASAVTEQLGASALPMSELIAGPVIFRPLSVFENFPSGSLGSAWSAAAGTWTAGTGYAQTNAATSESVLLRQASDAIGDGLARAHVALSATTSSTTYGLIARSTAAGCYLLRVSWATGTPKIGVLRKTNGSYVRLADATIPANLSYASGSDLIFVCRNNSTGGVDLTGFLGGRPIVAVTDSGSAAYMGPGQAGVRAYACTAQFSNIGIGL